MDDSAQATARPRLALSLGALASLALVPSFAILAPPSRWDPLVLLLALAAIGLISYFGSVAIRSHTFLDAQFVAALLATILLGPLPALSIWLLGEAAYFVLDRKRREAHLANAASYGWAVLTGSLVLDALAPAGLSSATPMTYIGVGLSAAVMLLANFAVTRLIVAIALDGRPLTGTIKHELVKPAPATALMVLTGTATALAYTEIGILALALFAIAAVIPQTLVLALLKPQPVSALERPAARAIYAQEIARTMGLGARKRLVLKDAALYMQEFPQRPPDGTLSDPSDRHRFDVIEAVLYGREHWGVNDSTPRPVGAEMTPLESRILAVSDVWAALTAKGSPKLSHQRALDHLEARASLHFDEQVVEAARQLIAQERFGPSAEAAYRPRLERNSFPRLAGRLQASARPSV